LQDYASAVMRERPDGRGRDLLPGVDALQVDELTESVVLTLTVEAEEAHLAEIVRSLESTEQPPLVFSGVGCSGERLDSAGG